MTFPRSRPRERTSRRSGASFPDAEVPSNSLSLSHWSVTRHSGSSFAIQKKVADGCVRWDLPNLSAALQSRTNLFVRATGPTTMTVYLNDHETSISCRYTLGASAAHL